jgi:hypothetical protein
LISPVVVAVLAAAFPLCAVAEGPGLLVGESRLHLGLAVEGAHDNNVGFSSDPTADAVLHIKPMLKLDFPSEKVAFNLGLTGDVTRYLGVSEDTSHLSTVQGTASTLAVFNPKGRFNFTLRDDFTRSSEPRYDVVGTFARTNNVAGAAFDFKPGGGALLLGLGYSFAFDLFDEGTGLTGGDSYSHQPTFDVRWKFFPKTSFVLNVSGDLKRYPKTQESWAGSYRNVDMNAIRATVGLVGLVTPRLSATVRAGYGDTMAAEGANNYASVIGLAELSYDLTLQTRFTLGYSRDFQPALLFGYMGVDKFYASARQGLMGRLSLQINGAVALQGYGTPVASQGFNSGDRSDVLITVGAGADYEILPWLAIGVADNYQKLSTSFTSGYGAASYDKNVIGGYVKVMY